MKPDKARGVEDVILRSAQMGQIVEKVRIIHNGVSMRQIWYCLFGSYYTCFMKGPANVFKMKKQQCLNNKLFVGFRREAHIIAGTYQQPNY